MKLAQIGILDSSVFDVDALAFITAAVITDSGQKQAINYLVVNLKSNNLWSKFYALYPMVGGNATSHRYNLKNISLYQITWVNSPTHSSDGVAFDGTTQYGRMGLIPSSVLTLNNTSLHYYSKSVGVAAAARVDIGCSVLAASRILGLMLRTTPGDLLRGDYYTTSTTNGSVQATNTITAGMFSACRTAINQSKVYLTGAQIGVTNTNSNTGTLPNIDVYLAARNTNGVAGFFSNKTCAFAAISDGLSDSEVAVLYTIVQQYQTLLSRQV